MREEERADRVRHYLHRCGWLERIETIEWACRLDEDVAAIAREFPPFMKIEVNGWDDDGQEIPYLYPVAYLVDEIGDEWVGLSPIKVSSDPIEVSKAKFAARFVPAEEIREALYYVEDDDG